GFGASRVADTYKRAQQLVTEFYAPDQELTVLRGLWAFDIVRANFNAAHERSSDLLERAEKSSNRSLLVEAHHALGFTRGHEGQFEEAVAHHREALRLYDPGSRGTYTFLFALDPSVGCRMEMALDLWIMGFPDQARALSDEG